MKFYKVECYDLIYEADNGEVYIKTYVRYGNALRAMIRLNRKNNTDRYFVRCEDKLAV